MCTNSIWYVPIIVFPKIILPTCSSKRSYILIDQMFCKSPHWDHANISSLPKRPKYIQKRVISEAAAHNFTEELRSSDTSWHLHANLMTDPNPEYDIFGRIALIAYEKHSPKKRVKVNKHKHNHLCGSQHVVLIISIEFRDKFYKWLKSLFMVIIAIIRIIVPLCWLNRDYRQVRNISGTKSQHLKDSRTVLRLPLPNPLKPDVKLRMKM